MNKVWIFVKKLWIIEKLRILSVNRQRTDKFLFFHFGEILGVPLCSCTWLCIQIVIWLDINILKHYSCTVVVGSELGLQESNWRVYLLDKQKIKLFLMQWELSCLQNCFRFIVKSASCKHINLTNYMTQQLAYFLFHSSH